nr:MAG TPA: hypothetical protein [Caudoviricetes sp.]
MDNKEKQFKEATEMLDNICKLYNESNHNGKVDKDIASVLFLAILAVKSSGLKVEITTNENGYIERLKVSY